MRMISVVVAVVLAGCGVSGQGELPRKRTAPASRPIEALSVDHAWYCLPYQLASVNEDSCYAHREVCLAMAFKHFKTELASMICQRTQGAACFDTIRPVSGERSTMCYATIASCEAVLGILIDSPDLKPTSGCRAHRAAFQEPFFCLFGGEIGATCHRTPSGCDEDAAAAREHVGARRDSTAFRCEAQGSASCAVFGKLVQGSGTVREFCAVDRAYCERYAIARGAHDTDLTLFAACD